MDNELQDVLFEGENVLWQGVPDKFCYVWRKVGRLLPIAVIWLLFDGFFISTVIATGMDKETWWFFVIFFAFHLLPVWKTIGGLVTARLEYKNIIYAVTDKRVIVRTGLVGLDFENINYTDISNVRADVSVIERLRHVGSVFITTASGQAVCLAAVQEPYKVYKKINKVFMDMKSDIHYPNALRPEINPGYNTKYKG